MTISDVATYQQRLKESKFNAEQIELITRVKVEYEVAKTQPLFTYDNWERDLWYTMNQSGLFEDDENKTGITAWGVSHTRMYISEIKL
jgi:hypothetical protein